MFPTNFMKNELLNEDSSGDEIFVYNKVTLTSWKRKAMECERVKSELRAQASSDKVFVEKLKFK